jgi:hypothetical protein
MPTEPATPNATLDAPAAIPELNFTLTASAGSDDLVYLKWTRAEAPPAAGVIVVTISGRRVLREASFSSAVDPVDPSIERAPPSR